MHRHPPSRLHGLSVDQRFRGSRCWGRASFWISSVYDTNHMQIENEYFVRSECSLGRSGLFRDVFGEDVWTVAATADREAVLWLDCLL